MPIKTLAAAGTFRKLANAWRDSDEPLNWGGFWGSSKALATAALAAESGNALVVVVADSASMDLAIDDLSTFGAGAIAFPAREGRLGTDAEVLRERFHALDLVARDGFCGILVAPLASLLQPIPAADDSAAFVALEQDQELDADAFLRRLIDAGFERVPAITEPGQVAMRGDILDFYAPALGEPLRLEFFDNELESIRVFDLASQRTRHVLKHVRVPLGRELSEIAVDQDQIPLAAMPTGVRVVVWEPGLVEEAEQRLRLNGGQWSRTLHRNAASKPWGTRLELATLPGRDGTLDVLSVEEYCRGVVDGSVLLHQRASDHERGVLCCATDAEQTRLEHLLAERDLDPTKLQLHQGGLARGFRIPEARLTVLHHRELVPGHGYHRPKPRRSRHESTPIEAISALKPGNIVVHAVHGIGCFRGIDKGEPSVGSGAGAESGEQDVIVIEFSGGSLLQVPVSRIDLVERYIGAGGSTSPTLDRLGSGSFGRRRKKVESAVEDMAAELLEIQAKRTASLGTAFPTSKEQAEFDASFPWEDTPDQAQGTREILADLAMEKPMDRLLCGDVGYGKTELAARAAFAVLEAGWQAALLCPTTVLSEQHTRSMQQRFADWPLHIGQLSRIVPLKERRETLAGLKSGSVDLVIGTHRLLSRDVEFSKLGLVIIDEEQRFGVRAKIQLTRKRAEVDVLALSATPIPRTLHMAMAGLRDITSLATAPVGRMEIHTEIRYGDEDAMVREAIRREIARGGQIFFVHNRVKSLQRVADRVQKLVPEARIVIGHGQMGAKELEKAMLTFVRGHADILCSTTIVESGLDIPNANTIFIDDANMYGLADLHQLRGRVGRSTRRGWCYLLIQRGKPLAQDSRRRLKAVEELRFLGAGFQIAMRDLEIRGAGNLLGGEQSGHINAVGYETYRRLLAQAVARLKRRSFAVPQKGHAADISIGVEAALPPTFVPDEATRIAILREFDGVRDAEEIGSLISMVRDRFGPPPPEVENLARMFYLKHKLGEIGLESLHRVGDRLVCTVRSARNLQRAISPLGIDLRTITARQTHWILPDPKATPAEVLDHLFETASACLKPRAQRKSSPSSK